LSDLAFAWEPAKAAINLEKHGVSFDEAATVFRNPLAKVLPDPTHSQGEERAIMIGHSEGGRLLLVVFMQREDRIRIISAREVSRRERREYEEHS
jgi:uncharacterized DUF497 family protein